MLKNEHIQSRWNKEEEPRAIKMLKHCKKKRIRALDINPAKVLEKEKGRNKDSIKDENNNDFP
jgi:hypothetical protein